MPPLDPFTTNRNAAGKLLAWYFVIVWGSSYLAIRVALEYTAPFTLLTLRYTLGLICLGLLALILRFDWPRTWQAWLHAMAAGLLVHAIYLGGSHYAQYLGMPAGTIALVLALQPLLTACLALWWWRERLTPAQWLGVALGFTGVLLVIAHKIDVAAITASSLLAAVISLTGVTLGTLYQRRFCADSDLRSLSLIQFAVSWIVLAPLAWHIEGLAIRWSWQLIAATVYLVIGASILALNAFHWLMRHGQATRVAGLLYLTPIIAVLLEYLMFDVRPGLTSLAGMGVACVGVALLGLGARRRMR